MTIGAPARLEQPCTRRDFVGDLNHRNSVPALECNHGLEQIGLHFLRTARGRGPASNVPLAAVISRHERICQAHFSRECNTGPTCNGGLTRLPAESSDGSALAPGL